MSTPAPWRFRLKLSQGSLLLLHLVAMGHVWRDSKGRWVASTERDKRVVDERIQKMVHQGFLVATYADNFPKLSGVGQRYLKDHPLDEVLRLNPLRKKKGPLPATGVAVRGTRERGISVERGDQATH